MEKQGFKKRGFAWQEKSSDFISSSSFFSLKNSIKEFLME